MRFLRGAEPDFRVDRAGSGAENVHERGGSASALHPFARYAPLRLTRGLLAGILSRSSEWPVVAGDRHSPGPAERPVSVSMYRRELRIVGGTISSTAPAPAGKGTVRGLYIVTVPEGTASGRRVGDSGASWCRVVAAAPVPCPSLPDRPRRIGAWCSRSRGLGIAQSR